MKRSKTDINVDFIGDAKPLSAEEEKKISDYIRTKKRSDKAVKTTEKISSRRQKELS